MEIIGIIIFALFGMFVGSFLNVCIDRLPAGESIVSPPSHCPSCLRQLSWFDMVPVLSFLWLRGACRSCRAQIPKRILWVETSTGMLFGYLFLHYGLTYYFGLATLYCSLFTVLFVIDWERGLILNKIVYPASLAALIIGFFVSPSMMIFSGGQGSYVATGTLWKSGILQAVVGGAVGLLIFLFIVIVSRGGMGWGDVKMAGLIGLITGFPSVFVALFLAILSGGVTAVFLLLFKAKGRKDSIPFGPFLSLGVIITLLWGANIVNWYSTLF